MLECELALFPLGPFLFVFVSVLTFICQDQIAPSCQLLRHRARFLPGYCPCYNTQSSSLLARLSDFPFSKSAFNSIWPPPGPFEELYHQLFFVLTVKPRCPAFSSRTWASFDGACERQSLRLRWIGSRFCTSRINSLRLRLLAYSWARRSPRTQPARHLRLELPVFNIHQIHQPRRFYPSDTGYSLSCFVWEHQHSLLHRALLSFSISLEPLPFPTSLECSRAHLFFPPRCCYRRLLSSLATSHLFLRHLHILQQPLTFALMTRTRRSSL